MGTLVPEQLTGIFPNPATDFVYVKFENNSIEKFDINIYDFQGKWYLIIRMSTKTKFRLQTLNKVFIFVF